MERDGESECGGGDEGEFVPFFFSSRKFIAVCVCVCECAAPMDRKPDQDRDESKIKRKQ